MRARSREVPSSFPHWVAVGSLVFALGLFFSNTVPALREQQSLRDVATELVDLRRQYEDMIRRTELGIASPSSYDLQSLLVAIDQLGYTPLELCAAHPERAPFAPPSADAPSEDAPSDAPSYGDRPANGASAGYEPDAFRPATGAAADF